MPTEIIITDKQLQDGLNRLAFRMENLAPLMRAIAGDMHDAIEENFAKQGRPPWAELSETTIAQRQKEGTWPGKTLQRSGSMATAVTTRSDAVSATASIAKVQAKTLHFGAKKGAFGKKPVTQKVKKHERKTKSGKIITVKPFQRTITMSIPWGDIPARPFMHIPEADLIGIKKRIEKHLTKG